MNQSTIDDFKKSKMKWPVVLIAGMFLWAVASTAFGSGVDLGDPLGLTSNNLSEMNQITAEIGKLKNEITDKEQKIYNIQQEIDMTGGEIQRLKGEWEKLSGIPYDKDFQ